MLLPALLIVLVWSVSLLIVAGLCVAARRGDHEPVQGVATETAPSLRPLPSVPAAEPFPPRASPSS